jgi:hypothetical protein
VIVLRVIHGARLLDLALSRSAALVSPKWHRPLGGANVPA